MSLFSLSKLTNQSLLRNTGAYINGKWINDGQMYNVVDPATSNTPIATVRNCNADDAKAAIDAAQHSMQNNKQWSLPRVRSRALRKWFDLVLENQDDLAKIVSAESGKPYAEALGEVKYGGSFLEWFSEEAPRIYGDTIQSSSTMGRRMFTIKQPIGVCSLITPFNFPIAMITRKAGAALAAGCSVVIKPSPETPLSALALASLAQDAGIPDGIINVLPTSREGTPSVGLEMCTNKAVAKISFTGSTAVGRLLMSQASSTIKKVSFELGGNAPFIVFKDADLENAADALIASKFRNSGQTCVSTNRVFIEDSIYPQFSQMLIDRVSKLTVGPGLSDNGVQIGPLITETGAQKVMSHIQDAVSKGGNILCGGKQLTDMGKNFVAPTIVEANDKTIKVSCEETFGPLVALWRFSSEQQVIEMANDTEVGLAAYFCSKDLSRVFRVAEKLQVGMVGVNEGIISAAEAPFGGVKQSGIGREGSKYGIDDYVQIKYISIGNIQE